MITGHLCCFYHKNDVLGYGKPYHEYRYADYVTREERNDDLMYYTLMTKTKMMIYVVLIRMRWIMMN